MELRKMLASGSAAALLALSAGGASAATVISGGDNGGNICDNGIKDCSITLESGVVTPAFAKFERSGGSYTAAGTLGSVGDFVISPINSKSASFTYTVENGDLGLNAIYVKGGNLGGVLFTYDEGDFSYDATTMTFAGTFSTAGLLNGGGNQPNISNVVFFDSFTFPGGGGGENPPPVPLPAAGFMLLAGLGGLAAAKRRKN